MPYLSAGLQGVENQAVGGTDESLYSELVMRIAFNCEPCGVHTKKRKVEILELIPNKIQRQNI